MDETEYTYTETAKNTVEYEDLPTYVTSLFDDDERVTEVVVYRGENYMSYGRTPA